MEDYTVKPLDFGTAFHKALEDSLSKQDESRIVLAALRLYESLCVDCLTHDQALNADELKWYEVEVEDVSHLIDLYTKEQEMLGVEDNG